MIHTNNNNISSSTVLYEIENNRDYDDNNFQLLEINDNKSNTDNSDNKEVVKNYKRNLLQIVKNIENNSYIIDNMLTHLPPDVLDFITRNAQTSNITNMTNITNGKKKKKRKSSNVLSTPSYDKKSKDQNKQNLKRRIQKLDKIKIKEIVNRNSSS